MTTSTKAPWLMLVARSALFLSVQVLFFCGFWLAGNPGAWQESARWWPFFALITNIIIIYLLVRLFRAEGCRYLDILRFNRKTVKTDLLWLLGTSVIGLPLAAAPMNILSPMLYGDALTAPKLLFQPLPLWAIIVSFLFPLTIAFAELPAYFGYVMPRLAAQLNNSWIAWLLAALALALQHVFLPLLPDGRFILYRALMYLPFALFAGLIIKLRPGMLPYFAAVHALMDISAVAMYFVF